MPTIQKQPNTTNSLFLSADEIMGNMIDKKYKFDEPISTTQSLIFPGYKRKDFKPLVLKSSINTNLNTGLKNTKPKSTTGDTGVDDGTDEGVDDVTQKKGISTVTGANIATGISTLANVATSLYGAKMASKMEPSLISKPADIEPDTIAYKTSAIESAGKENIEKSVNTARDSYRKAGLTGMDGVLLSKQNEALNQLSGQLAQYVTNIDAQNAQTTNQVNQVNATNKLNVDMHNAGIINQSDSLKSGLIGSGIQNASENLRAGTESIFNNLMGSAQMNLSSINDELKLLTEELRQPVTGNTNYIAQKKRYAELMRQKDQIENSTFGKPYLKYS